MSKKIVALDSTGAGMLVRSPKLPAEKTATAAWRVFNEFVRDAEKLREYVRDLNALRFEQSEDDYRWSGEIEDEALHCQELAAKVRAGLEQFDRADNYEDGELKHSYVAKRLGVMIGSFPNANPHAPDAYARMLVEHVAAIEDLTDIALESACREIVETEKFAPAISEVVEMIGKHMDQWASRRWALNVIDRVRAETIEALRKREEDKLKQQHEHELQETISEAKRAMLATQRLAKDIEAAKEKLAALIQ
jgi:hypothetical protein